MSTTEPTTGRRTLLAASAGVAAAAVVPGVAAQSDALEEHLDGVDNYDGIEDHTDQDEVTVDVGAGDAGLRFAPPAIRVSPGTTVVWEWTGEGGAHNVEAESGAFESELTDEAGFTFEQTVEERGAVLYYCDPHRGAGMRGAIVVGDGGLAGSGGSAGDGGGSADLLTVGGVTALLLAPLAIAVGLLAKELSGRGEGRRRAPR